MSKIQLFHELQSKIQSLKNTEISAGRKKKLQPLIDFIQHKRNSGEPIQLNFICTHNSRRSQLGQIWAQAVSAYYGIDSKCYSGGTEMTAFYENAMKVLIRAGFRIESQSTQNPRFRVYFSDDLAPLICYSKVYNTEENPSEKFAAVMTCSHADENCPFIQGSEIRIPLDYKDPKEFDGTPLAEQKYDERSDQIASEMIYVFANID